MDGGIEGGGMSVGEERIGERNVWFDGGGLEVGEWGREGLEIESEEG